MTMTNSTSEREQRLIDLADEHARDETTEYKFACTVLGAAESAGLLPNGITRELRQQQTKQFVGGVIERLYGLTQKEISLLDGKAAELYPPVTDTGRGRCRHNVPTCGECQVNEVLAHVAEKEKVRDDAATAMRDLCVEKVKKKAASYQADVDRLGAALKYRERMAYTASALREVANELQSLTLDNQQPVKEEAACCISALLHSRQKAERERKLEQEQK